MGNANWSADGLSQLTGDLNLVIPERSAPRPLAKPVTEGLMRELEVSLQNLKKPHPYEP